MKINLKTNDQIAQMRIAGKLAAEVLEMITPLVVPGVSTEELDRICHDYIVDNQQSIPANVGYNGLRKLSAQVLTKLYAMEFHQRKRFLKMGIFLISM